MKGYLRCAQWKLAHWRKPAAFQCDGVRHQCFAHGYNRTWKNERAVEIPLVMKVVRDCRAKRILEVGNVLSHYFNFPHDVLDKYEVGRGIIQKDIVEFHPAGHYDLIVSVSTLEHVGWDETPRVPEKVIDALRHMKSLLAPGGCMALTFPVNYNPFLDEFVRANTRDFGVVSYVKRITEDAEWQQVDAASAAACAYGKPYPFANAIAFSVFNNASPGAGVH